MIKSLSLTAALFAIGVLSRCSTITPVAKPSCPDCVEQTVQDAFGTMTLYAPDASGFDDLKTSGQKVFVECEYVALVKKTAEEIADASTLGTAEVKPVDEDLNLSKQGKERCLKIADQLLAAKGFSRVGSRQDLVALGGERWLFHFEETRKEFEKVKWSSLLTPPEYARMWGTLSRFKANKTRPYSHILLSGRSHYLRGRVTPAPDHLAVAAAANTDAQSLIGVLMRGLLQKAILDPTAGSADIDP